MKSFTKATAVYIGKLIQPNKPIKEDSDDTAHHDFDADRVVRFTHANPEHSFLVDKILNKDQGLTFDVFKDVIEEVPVEEAEFVEEERADEAAK